MQQVKNLAIKKVLYKCYKYNLTFYLSPLETVESSKAYTVRNNPCIYFAMPYANGAPADIAKKRSFRIGYANINRVLRTLENVIAWFNPNNEQYKDLYFVDDTGTLRFNSDYNGLYEVTPRGYFDNEILRFVPTLVEVPGGKNLEGVRVFVNVVENSMSLTVDELITLYDVLSTVNITNLTNELLLSVRPCAITDSIISEQAYRDRFGGSGFKNDYY